MKKLLIIPVVAIVLLTGCDDKMKKIESTMYGYAKKYYEDYMTAPNLDIAEITIEMLENANTEADAGFDLTKLDKCTKESKIELHVKPDTRTIEKSTYDMNCEK